MCSAGADTLPQVEIFKILIFAVVVFVMGVASLVMNSDCAYSYKIPRGAQKGGRGRQWKLRR